MRAAALLLLPACLRTYALASAAKKELTDHSDHEGLFNFVSRPDIRAPKWEIEVYDQDALAPGYWFFGPYETLNMDDSFGNGWIGPHIYKTDGTLIWSGAPLFDNGNIEDFRISNVNGKEMMTVMDQRNAKGVFIDNHFNVVDRKMANGPERGTFNSHEFHFVDNGTKALVVWTKGRSYEPEETLEALDRNMTCHVACDGINEYDVKTWKSSFSWTSCDHIGLEESTYKTDFLDKQCSGRWDYVHANSVDKTPEGDFILSGRHTNAIFKISKDDGHIMWRLGGVKSDFVHKDDFVFSRQHDIRYRGANETHTILSMLDNAKGLDGDDPTHPFSRGLLIALDESASPMTAEIIAHYDHPEGDGGLAFRRGNYQPLDNGNVFMCWSERALQSEHSADGKMLMQAKLATEFLGTYRAYKFDFVGMPDVKPNVTAMTRDVKSHGGTATDVWVSWNGATEVDTWNLYKTTKRGKPRVLVDQQTKTDFETKLGYDGFAQFVIAEALSSDGGVLGTAKVLKVDTPNNTTPAVEEEQAWQSNPVNRPWWDSTFIMSGAALIAAAAIILGAWTCIRRHGRGSRTRISFMDIFNRGRYARLDDGAKELKDQQSHLMNGHRRRQSDADWDGEDFRGEHTYILGDEDDEEDDDGRARTTGRRDMSLEGLEAEEGVGGSTSGNNI